jgi:outer membrane protein OmpA-like peptidoglycan-associated protein
MWSSDKFPKLVEWAKRYDIYVAEFTKGARGKLGFFELEYLNNWKPIIIEKVVEKKHIPWWVWLLLGLAVVGIVIALLCRPKAEPQVITVTDTVVETVYVHQLEEIEDNFNAAQFQLDKADLSEDAKFVLHDLAKLMNKYPELKLRIEGHTSAEGDANHNQKLSEARAQAAVTFLVEHGGIDASRLEAAGFGSSKLKNTDDPMSPENRRTEFEIIK